MGSHYYSSNSGLDRKSLKRPDSFLAALSRFFSGLVRNANLFAILIGALFGVGLLTTLLINRMDSKSEKAQNGLYLAEKTLATEMKALTPSVGTDSPQGAPKAPSVDFKRMDVDAQFPKSIQELKAVEESFSHTRAAFDARLKLADLYYNHGDYQKAHAWYEKAVDTAPGNFEKALALSSLGYVKENLGKPAEAIQTYQKAINLGEGSLKGDLLMGIARGYEAVHDTPKARSTYDQILIDLPNTEFSKSAEVLKNQL